MQKISGTRILTGTFWAASSAHWRRLTRISEDCTRSTCPTGMPNASACTMALTKERRSGRLVRSASERRASERPRPICISCSMRANSSDERPVGVARHLGAGGVEPEAGLDRDGEQVDRVGKGALQLSRRGRRSLVEVHVRRHVARERGEDDDTRAWAGSPRPISSASTSDDDQGDAEAHDLAGHHPLDGPAARVAGQLELLADALAGVLGRQSPAHPLAAGQQREEHAVAEAAGRARPSSPSGAAGERLEDGDGAVHAGPLLEDAADGAEHQEQGDEDQRRTQ